MNKSRHDDTACAVCVDVHAACAASAQTVDFNNTRTFARPADRKVYLDYIGGTALAGTNYVAQLYYGANASSLIPVTSNPTRFRNVPTSDPLAGTWVGVTRTLTGFSLGNLVTLQVRVWDQNYGTTWDEAQGAGARYGQSQPFIYRVPVGSEATNTYFIENFRGFAMVPEPTGSGLAVPGGAVLLLAAKRKPIG